MVEVSSVALNLSRIAKDLDDCLKTLKTLKM